MAEGRIKIGESYYKDTGCHLFPSCLECSYDKCELDRLRGGNAISYDLQFLGRVAFRFKNGGYDLLDGKLPLNEAMARVINRNIKLNNDKDLPTKHLEDWLEKFSPPQG